MRWRKNRLNSITRYSMYTESCVQHVILYRTRTTHRARTDVMRYSTWLSISIRLFFSKSTRSRLVDNRWCFITKYYYKLNRRNSTFFPGNLSHAHVTFHESMLSILILKWKSISNLIRIISKIKCVTRILKCYTVFFITCSVIMQIYQSREEKKIE